jgi:hypothetical protein
MDIEGEAKILGTIQRKLKKGDSPIGFEQLVPGLDAVRAFQGNQQPPQNRAARRQRKPQASNGNSIRYPAATLNPIGIY